MIEILKQEVVSLSPCAEGYSSLLQVKSNTEAFELFFKHIDFCLAKEFPDKDSLKTMSGQFESGIVVDRKYVIRNPERLAVLGKSDIELQCSGFAVSRVYAKHNSVIYIHATDNAYVVVDALDNAQVFCNVSGRAKVVVNRFIGAQVSGATKIIEKNRETYELQA